VQSFFLITLLLFSGCLWADEALPQQEPPIAKLESATINGNVKNNFVEGAGLLVSTPKPSVSTLSNWPVVILMLLGIVCLILCLAWFVKRYGGFSMAGARDMRVLSSVPLGARERVALIDVKGQQFLVGVTTQNINHLHTFDEPVVDTQKVEASNTTLSGVSKNDFAEKLHKLLKVAKSSSDDRA